MNKKETIHKLEYEVKLLQLRIKYEANFFNIFIMTIQARMLLFQIMVVASQPIPKFKSGGIKHTNISKIAHINTENKTEYIQTREGEKIALSSRKSVSVNKNKN